MTLEMTEIMCILLANSKTMLTVTSLYFNTASYSNKLTASDMTQTPRCAKSTRDAEMDMALLLAKLT